MWVPDASYFPVQKLQKVALYSSSSLYKWNIIIAETLLAYITMQAWKLYNERNLHRKTKTFLEYIFLLTRIIIWNSSFQNLFPNNTNVFTSQGYMFTLVMKWCIPTTWVHRKKGLTWWWLCVIDKKDPLRLELCPRSSGKAFCLQLNRHNQIK